MGKGEREREKNRQRRTTPRFWAGNGLLLLLPSLPSLPLAALWFNEQTSSHEEKLLRQQTREINMTWHLDGSDAKFLGSLQVHSEVIKEDGFTRLHVQCSQCVLINPSLWFTHPHFAWLHHLDTHSHPPSHLDLHIQWPWHTFTPTHPVTLTYIYNVSSLPVKIIRGGSQLLQWRPLVNLSKLIITLNESDAHTLTIVSQADRQNAWR